MHQRHGERMYSDKEITECYYKFKTLSKMSVELRLPDVSVWRRCKKLGLVFKHTGFKEKIEIKDILDGKHPQYQTNKLRKRLLKEKILENKCSVCNITEWNDKPVIFELDHIDGDCKNHKLENLRLICPNCHSQTNTYCGKNKLDGSCS